MQRKLDFTVYDKTQNQPAKKSKVADAEGRHTLNTVDKFNFLTEFNLNPPDPLAMPMGFPELSKATNATDIHELNQSIEQNSQIDNKRSLLPDNANSGISLLVDIEHATTALQLPNPVKKTPRLPARENYINYLNNGTLSSYLTGFQTATDRMNFPELPSHVKLTLPDLLLLIDYAIINKRSLFAHYLLNLNQTTFIALLQEQLIPFGESYYHPLDKQYIKWFFVNSMTLNRLQIENKTPYLPDFICMHCPFVRELLVGSTEYSFTTDEFYNVLKGIPHKPYASTIYDRMLENKEYFTDMLQTLSVDQAFTLLKTFAIFAQDIFKTFVNCLKSHPQFITILNDCNQSNFNRIKYTYLMQLRDEATKKLTNQLNNHPHAFFYHPLLNQQSPGEVSIDNLSTPVQTPVDANLSPQYLAISEQPHKENEEAAYKELYQFIGMVS